MPKKISPEYRRAIHLNYTAKPENRIKLRTRERCAWAIKAGKLIRQPCEKCSAEKSETHHDDYSKPFDVRWLCRRCHAAEHHKSHCIRGHALTPDNIIIGRGNGHRRGCRQCNRAFDSRKRIIKKQLQAKQQN